MEVLAAPKAVDFSEDISLILEDPEEEINRQVLMARIESELGAAKARYGKGMNVEEVLLPSGLLNSVATDILTAARVEPCGIRGCLLNIDFSDESQNGAEKKRVGKVVCDPYAVTTFELTLTLRPKSSWTLKLPQFLRNLANRTTMVISSNYILGKKQLYCFF